MSGNFLIQKKLERDTGLAQNPGAHLRTNLKEIVAVEHLFVAESWLENPCEKRQSLKIWPKPIFWMKTLTNFGLCVGKTGTVGYLLSWKMKQSNLKMSEHMKVKWKKLQKT